MADEGQWWIRDARGDVEGPLTTRQIGRRILRQEIDGETLCSKDQTTWVRAAAEPELGWFIASAGAEEDTPSVDGVSRAGPRAWVEPRMPLGMKILTALCAVGGLLLIRTGTAVLITDPEPFLDGNDRHRSLVGLGSVLLGLAQLLLTLFFSVGQAWARNLMAGLLGLGIFISLLPDAAAPSYRWVITLLHVALLISLGTPAARAFVHDSAVRRREMQLSRRRRPQ